MDAPAADSTKQLRMARRTPRTPRARVRERVPALPRRRWVTVLAQRGCGSARPQGCTSRTSTSNARWFTFPGASGKDRTLPRRRRTRSARLTSTRRSPRCFGSSSANGKRVGSSKSCAGTPLAHGNLRKRVLHPLLERLGIPKAALHAFRHSRVTQLRNAWNAPGSAEAVDRPQLAQNRRPVQPHA
jgi:hypothetical protein